MKLVDKKSVIFVIIFIGFILGILYTNLFAADYLALTGVFSMHYLQEYAKKELVSGCLIDVMMVRIVPLIVLILLGYSKIHKIGAIAFLMWTGFLWGIYMALGVIQLGGMGLFFGALSVIPQILFYVPAYVIVLIFAYRYPDSNWNIWKISVILLCMICGIVLECQVNPLLLRWGIELM